MIPYTELLPLRSTTVWGAFELAEAVPHRYGETTGECVQYNAQRTQWVWSDGAIDRITRVTVGDQVRGDWTWRNDIDVAGKAVGLLLFQEPLPVGARPIATGRGKLNLARGGLIESPADIVTDIVQGIAGNPLDAERLGAFRDATLGIRCAGTLREGTLQSAVRGLCASVGAIFSPLHPGLCQLHPGGGAGGDVVHTVDGSDPTVSIAASCSRADLVTQLLIEFDVADDQPRQTVELADSNARNVRRRTIRLDWIADRRIAIDIGSRLLAHWSRPRWVYAVGDLPGIVRPGDLLDITSRRVCDADGVVATALRVSIDHVAQRSSIAAADTWLL